MKRIYLIIPILATMVAFAACKKKASPSSEPSKAETEQPETVAPEPIKASATINDRAAKLGFAKHLPKDIAIYDAIFNGRKAFDMLMGTGLGEFLLERMEDEGISMDDLEKNETYAAQIAQYSEEYFTAYGEGTEQGIDLTIEFIERLGFYAARFAVFLADGKAREGENFAVNDPTLIFQGPLKGAPKELVKMLAEFDMPTYYQGAKISNKELRDQVVVEMEQLVSMLSSAQEAAEEITIKRGSSEFSGYKISGEKLAEMLDDNTIEQMREVIDIKDIEAFKANLSKKNLIAVYGVVGDYVLLFFGESEDDLVIVDKVEDSLCANEDIVFLDNYLSKDLLSVGFRDSKIVKQVGNVEALGYRVLSYIARGVRDALGTANSLGDTQDVEAMLESLDEQGNKLASMFSGTDAGYAAYLEEGLKVETFGGSNLPAFDFDKTHTLAGFGGGEGTLLFANWTTNEAYNEKVMAYVDTLGETGYLIAKHIAALDIESDKFNNFKQSLGMFDKSFSSDVLELWKAMRIDMAAGLGAETALVIDINGSLPKVPSIPRGVLKEGKIPRISYVSTVNDRAKLQASWQRINTSAEKILATISDMAGKEIPMQDMMSSEKGDLTTWWTSIPFTGNDFLPSISVSDQLFFASTSKTFSEGLAAEFDQGGSEPRKGYWLEVDFKLLHQYASEWFDLVANNADEIFTTDKAREDFTANKEKIGKAVQALSTLNKLTLHSHNEAGRTRTSMHLKGE